MAVEATVVTVATAHFMKAAVGAATEEMEEMAAVVEAAMVPLLTEREAVVMASTIMDMAETRMEREPLASVLSLMSLKNPKNNPNKRR